MTLPSEERDPAREVHALYLAFWEDCKHAGIPALTPEEWVNSLEDKIREARDEPPT